MQVSDDELGSDRPILMYHRRREMRYASMDIVDPKLD